MTKLALANQPDYAAQVIQITSLVDLPGLDNLKGLPWAGFMALVSKDMQVGDVVVVIPAGAQLSTDWTSRLNLFSDNTKNADTTAKGYLEDNRRVRAIRLRGHRSDALVLRAEQLGVSSDQVGMTFDTIDEMELVRKYVMPEAGGRAKAASALPKKVRRVEDKFLPEHIDTLNFLRNVDKLDNTTQVVVTQKLHGTSIRLAHTLVNRKLSWWERLLQRVGVPIQTTCYDYVFGSRKVIKDPNNPDQNHFYYEDLWTREGLKYAPLIPKNVILYGELIGWVSEGSPIQKGYTYNIPNGRADLYIYRVAVVGADGGLYDLSWDAVVEFCNQRGLKVTPELFRGTKQDVLDRIDSLMDVDYSTMFPGVVSVDKGKVDEGIVVRAEGIQPLVFKAKSPVFLQHESSLMDQNVVDLEETQKVEVSDVE